MKRYEGSVLTVNENNEVVRHLVEKDGRIVYVGNELPKQYEKTIDQQGRIGPGVSG